ncbi:hypothetical protein ACLOJK_029517 [Asimina triloba]
MAARLLSEMEDGARFGRRCRPGVARRRRAAVAGKVGKGGDAADGSIVVVELALPADGSRASLDRDGAGRMRCRWWMKETRWMLMMEMGFGTDDRTELLDSSAGRKGRADGVVRMVEASGSTGDERIWTWTA